MVFMCFVFKQKPAYEMRIRDWSSDVCSSDLPTDVFGFGIAATRNAAHNGCRREDLECAAPSASGRAMPPRLLKLFLGLVAYGVSMVMMLQSDLGMMPWDVLHQVLSLQGGWPMGRVTIAVSFAVLLVWIPIRQRSEEHTSELQSLMRISYAFFCLKQQQKH